jgi:hypothetical protein
LWYLPPQQESDVKRYLALFFFSFSVLANDQCQLMNKEVADRARLLLKPGAEILSFCMPCGDKVENSSVEEVKTVESLDINGMVEIRLNKNKNEAFDLAYKYLKVAPNTFVNLAKVTGCPAKDIPGSISLE